MPVKIVYDAPKFTKMQDWISTLDVRAVTRPDGSIVTLRHVLPHKVEELQLRNPECRINALNLRNRPPLAAQINLISDDISEGRWNEQIDNIKYILDESSEHNGTLSSGQHRLLAILRAKRSVWIEFQGITSDSIRLVDTNRHRTQYQNLGMAYNIDKKHQPILASVILYNHLFINGVIPERRTNAVADIYTDVQWTSVYAKIRDFIPSRTEYAIKDAFKSESVFLGFIALLRSAGVERGMISDYVSALGKPDEEMDAHIRNAINGYYTEKAGVNATNYFKQFIAAWNSFATGECNTSTDYIEGLDRSKYMLLVTE